MADSTKKRKRDNSGGEKMSKKVTIATPPSTITFSFVENRDVVGPVVAVSPGISIPQDVSLKPYTRSRSGADRSGSHRSKEELLLHSSQHPKIDYTAREDAEGSADSLLKHYIGVYDPQTGMLEAVEVRKMTIQSVVRSQAAEAQSMKENHTASSIWEQRNELGQTFGTKKAKKAIASLTENAISPTKANRSKIDSTANVMLQSIGEVTSSMATREQLQASTDEAKPRPAANLEATNVAEVYTLESLVGGAEILKQLPITEWAKAAKKKEEVRTTSRFVSRRLANAARDTRRLKCLSAILTLLSFLGAAKTRGRSSNRSLPLRNDLRKAMGETPDPVIESVRRRFSERGEMTKFHVDLLITHVCALALLADNFEVDLFDLSEDLRLEQTQLMQYFKEIGATIHEPTEKMRKQMDWEKAVASQRKVARLKLPLSFPRARFMRKR